MPVAGVCECVYICLCVHVHVLMCICVRVLMCICVRVGVFTCLFRLYPFNDTYPQCTYRYCGNKPNLLFLNVTGGNGMILGLSVAQAGYDSDTGLA
jgi:hypothetical protein